MCGLVVATDYRRGQKLIVDKDFAANAEFFQTIFEIGRRHKAWGVIEIKHASDLEYPPPPSSLLPSPSSPSSPSSSLLLLPPPSTLLLFLLLLFILLHASV